MEFPFSGFPGSSSGGGGAGSAGNAGAGGRGYVNVMGPARRGSGKTLLHPPMMTHVEVEGSPQLSHPPMLPPTGDADSAMEYLHASAGNLNPGACQQ